MINIFHNEEFIFDTQFAFDDRIGKDEYYAGEGDLHMIRQGNNIWETNFVPDMARFQLTDYGRPRPGLVEHQVRPRRRDHARAHVRDRAGDATRRGTGTAPARTS